MDQGNWITLLTIGIVIAFFAGCWFGKAIQVERQTIAAEREMKRAVDEWS